MQPLPSMAPSEPPDADLPALEDETRDEVAPVHAQGEELKLFVARIRKRRPIATYSLAAAIGLVYLMQLYVGMESPPTLLRMGALSAARVAQGEWWRLLTCTFLHGGFWHVLFNVYVLVILGSFLERLIGPARLLLLYFVSALLGSVGSVLFLGETFSVGASGAVWGLLGAHAVLAFRKHTLLPAAMVPGARKAALINLGINLLNSFRPHVDMWAHFFGGAGGAVLLVSGLITRGLSKAVIAGGAPDAPGTGVPTPSWLKGAAGLSVLVMVTALGVGWSTTHPLALKRAPHFAPRTLAATDVELDLPVSLQLTRTEDTTTVLGDVLEDPMVIDVFQATIDPVRPEQVDAVLTQLELDFDTPEGSTLDIPARRFVDGDSQGLEIRYVYPSGLRLELAFVLREEHVVRVAGYRWPDLVSAPEGSAVRIAKSARLL